MEEGGAWINIADVLNLAGRTEEALAAARQGLDAGLGAPWRTSDWLRLAISDFSFQLGDWDEAEAGDPGGEPQAHRRHVPLLADVPRAAGARRGDLDARRGGDRRASRGHRGSTEPQFLGPYGALSAELARRRGPRGRPRGWWTRARPDRVLLRGRGPDLRAGRGRPARGGRRGQAARDRRDEEASRLVRSRADALLERTRLAAESGVGRRGGQLAPREAEYARATGADSGPLWAAAAEALGRAPAPLPVELRALARGRGADGGGDREGAAGPRTRRSSPPAAWEAPGSWRRSSRSPPGAPAARRRRGRRRGPAEEPEDPFGLTARERDVLALVAAAPRTARSASGSTWPRRRPACTCRASSPSWTCARAPRRRRLRTGRGLVTTA